MVSLKNESFKLLFNLNPNYQSCKFYNDPFRKILTNVKEGTLAASTP